MRNDAVFDNMTSLKPARWLFLIILSVMMASCANGENKTHRAVTAAAGEFSRVYHDVDTKYHSSPMTIRLRRTPCPCDQDLKYEAHIYGSWRHILLVGNKKDLQALDTFSQNLPDGTPIDASILLTQEIFVSRSGQLFYTLYYIGNPE